ncbi:MAG: sensor histidine kinase [Eubacteriales bacterium]|nr:sensor histidine kinase [Eubacteriales bacterium]
MKFFKAYFRQRRIGIFVFFLFCAVFLCTFLLYHLPPGAILYPALLCSLLGFLFLISDFRRALQNHRTLADLQTFFSAEALEKLPGTVSVEAADYQQLLVLLQEEYKELENSMNLRYSDMMDYYTMWVHQIKTPIASMRLNLQNEDSKLSRNVSEDLFRIEQYVDMVFCYLRLDFGSTDYVIREYDLDAILKQAVRKFAGQFIRRKIRLIYEPINVKVLTDEKWLSFVLEQLLSNALKYTESGSITIELKEPKCLCIRDTGIGIAPEDLPRIFEKGYTGYNGRSDKRASGIGLYLCRRICQNLGHAISAESSLDKGTTLFVDLEERKLEVE